MKKALLAVAALACMGSAALAGPNAGGTLVVALSEGTIYTSDIDNYCGSATASSCAGIVNMVSGTDVVVLNVIAAFADGAANRLSGVTFGVDYNDAEVFMVAYGACGDFELPTGAWPAPGEGTAVTWTTAQTTQLVEVYWFAAYNYYGNPNTLCLIPHPTQGAMFADDDVPANLDPIADLGCFGFDADGFTPCPSGEIPGACCFPDGTCESLLQADCEANGGTFVGGDCTPELCAIPTGACCIGPDCFIRTQDECNAAQGNYLGDDSSCDPNPCEVIPTIDSSWGSVKANYR